MTISITLLSQRHAALRVTQYNNNQQNDTHHNDTGNEGLDNARINVLRDNALANDNDTPNDTQC